MMLEKNRVVAGRFRLIRTMGRGGTGSVRRALDPHLDIACALESSELGDAGELASVAEAGARFEREAKRKWEAGS